jgi:hypothetical protein
MLLKLKEGAKITLTRRNRETGASERAEVGVTERRFCKDTDKATLEVLITATPAEVDDAWAAEILGADADIEAVAIEKSKVQSPKPKVAPLEES